MSHTESTVPALHGLMAEFDSAEALLRAAERTHAAGYTKKDAFSPFPIHGLAETLGFRERSVAPIVLAGGLTGLTAGWGLEYWTSVIDYPLNVGGRPLHSWPAFIPPAFETTILGAALFCVLGMLALNGLPMPYHPVFNVPRFALSSRDRFFLCIEATDPIFETEATRRFLERFGPREVNVVEN